MAKRNKKANTTTQESADAVKTEVVEETNETIDESAAEVVSEEASIEEEVPVETEEVSEIDSDPTVESTEEETSVETEEAVSEEASVEEVPVETVEEEVPVETIEEAPVEEKKEEESTPVTISTPEHVTSVTAVNAVNIVKATSKKGNYRLGSVLDLVDEPLYNSPYSMNPFKRVTGRFYCYDGIEKNGTYRITDKKQHVKKDLKYIIGYIKK